MPDLGPLRTNLERMWLEVNDMSDATVGVVQDPRAVRALVMLEEADIYAELVGVSGSPTHIGPMTARAYDWLLTGCLVAVARELGYRFLRIDSVDGIVHGFLFWRDGASVIRGNADTDAAALLAALEQATEGTHGL